jgi:ferritin-like metal-binding protein YciE
VLGASNLARRSVSASNPTSYGFWVDIPATNRIPEEKEKETRMQTAHELFLHELSDTLDAEHRVLETLSGQIGESSNSTLKSAFHAHHKQTEGQIERLNQCFELLDEEPQETECAGIKGLSEEHESMIEEDPSPGILDVFNVAAAIKVERYEISSYESLIRLAELLKQAKIVRLLKQNLKEEEQTLKKMTTFASKVKVESLEELGAGDSATADSARKEGQQDERTGPQIVKRSGPRRNRAA